ncbi:calcium-binding protein [Sulfitobacter sp.]|uniref:calcium-binding protein n=1 Tax=Sulfitobacter sp. TaxID=1903071 RepID=UPI00300224D2
MSATGTPEQGETLSAVSTLDDEDGVGTLSYQWLRDGTAIDGATSASYALTPADVGAAMSARVPYTDGSETDEEKTSTETAAVTSSEPPCDEEGTGGPDIFVGKIFCTKFDGLGRNDSITGGPGGDGDDTINGGEGNDKLPGGSGNDVINGGPGNDRIGGGDGDDSMVGGDGDDGGGAGPGNDTIEAGGGNDRFNAGYGQEYIDMRAGDDISGASFGNDTMFGGDGDDLLTGGYGNDEIHGDAGEDTINSGLGDDTVTGGADADQFLFNALFGGGTTVITDFEDGIDTIRVVGLRYPPDPVGRLDITNTTIDKGEFAGQTGVAMSYADHTIIVLDTAEKDFSPSDFTVDDFLFV